MRFIIGIIVYWLTILGIKLFIENKYKVSKIISLPIVVSIIGIIMFLAGILNIMKITVIIMVLFSIGYLVYCIYKKNIKLNDVKVAIKKPTNIIIIVIFTYITIISLGMHLTHYDCFSHWGLIIKNMFMYDRLPNFENPIMFKGYQPGSACFIYFLGLLCGKNEASMIIGQNYLIFSYLVSLFLLIDKGILKKILIIAFYIFIMTISISFNNLLVDSLIAVMTISIYIILSRNKENPRMGLILSSPILIFLLLVKNTGLVLIGFCLLYELYLYLKQRKLKQGIIDILIMGMILIGVLLLWQGHVSMVYGSSGLSSKHSLSIANIVQSLQEKGIQNIFIFIKSYTNHFFSFANNISNIYMLGILIFLIIYGIIIKQKNTIIKLIACSIGIYIGYYIILGIMYILSMPWEEAKVFASYERYMTTILIIIVGIILIYIIQKNRINKSKEFLVYFILIVLLLIPIKYNFSNFKAMIGKTAYEGSVVEKYDRILKDIPLGMQDTYYIYAPISSKNDYGLLSFISIYKLNTSNVLVVSSLEDIYEANSGIVVMFDESKKSKKELLKNKWKKENNIIYIKGDKE